jgi:hypothetical protein
VLGAAVMAVVDRHASGYDDHFRGDDRRHYWRDGGPVPYHR